VGGGIFATLGIAANGSRGSTYISFLVGGAIALLTAYSYVHLSLTYPVKGGTVTFIEHGFGKGLFGSSMNVLLIFSYVILLAVYADAFGTYAANFFPVDQRHDWHVGLRSAVIVLMALILLARTKSGRAFRRLLQCGQVEYSCALRGRGISRQRAHIQPAGTI
jgi:amino acid transporter